MVPCGLPLTGAAGSWPVVVVLLLVVVGVGALVWRRSWRVGLGVFLGGAVVVGAVLIPAPFAAAVDCPQPSSVVSSVAPSAPVSASSSPSVSVSPSVPTVTPAPVPPAPVLPGAISGRVISGEGVGPGGAPVAQRPGYFQNDIGMLVLAPPVSLVVRLLTADGGRVVDLSGAVVGDQAVAGDGGYRFANLAAGSYQVVVVPSGLDFTPPGTMSNPTQGGAYMLGPSAVVTSVARFCGGVREQVRPSGQPIPDWVVQPHSDRLMVPRALLKDCASGVAPELRVFTADGVLVNTIPWQSDYCLDGSNTPGCNTFSYANGYSYSISNGGKATATVAAGGEATASWTVSFLVETQGSG